MSDNGSRDALPEPEDGVIRHYTSNELLAYLEDTDEVVDVAAIDAHLRNCDRCTERLGRVQLDYVLLTDPSLWEEVARTSAGALPPRRLAEYVMTQQRMAEETARAETVFADLAHRSLATWLEHLSLDPENYTDGMVARLIAAARADKGHDPQRALAVLDVAEAVALLAFADAEKAEVLGDVWKERANVHTVLGDWNSATVAIDRSEAIYDKSTIREYKLAFTTWARAHLFLEMERYADALPLAQSAASTFLRYGDTLRHSQVQILVAAVLYEQGEIARAERIFVSLLEPLERAGDRITHAHVLRNLACCRTFEDDLLLAEDYARRAIVVCSEFGLETAIIRTRWALARVYLRRGESERGIRALADVAGEFWQLHMEPLAAEVELDIVAEHIARRRYASAASIAGRLYSVFAKLDQRVSAAKALAFLYEATLGATATSELVRAVRHVVTHPLQPFVPPEQSA